jgi:hypothetical protein
MALKDLKSQLSNFRLPKKEPLDKKTIVDVSKTQNQTPLSGMVESAPKIPRSTTTTNKEGVNPQKMDNSSKFLGETNPQKMDSSEKFLGETNPQPMSLEERYLGQTTPNKFDNSEKFLGETTQTPSNRESKFLGETDPTKFDNTSNFVRFRNEKISSPFATEPNKMNLDGKFLGETTQTPSNRESKFLGETTPNPANNNSQFLGETTPNPANNGSQFLGQTTQTPSNRESKFLGETNPTPANNQSQFLGETTPTKFDNSEKFLGETTQTAANNGSQFLGETSPNNFTFNPNHQTAGVTPSEVNYIQDIHAVGFTSKFGGVEATKFIGVNPNNTVFDTTTSKYGDFNMSVDGLSSAPGYGKFKLNKAQTGNTQRYNPNKKYYINTQLSNKSISELQEMRNSPSFLDEMYSKYNLKDDSFNTGLGLFRQPFILRGIQRNGISKGEPQSWSGFGVTFDDGLIRGGIVTSTARALIDVARISSWFASVPGMLWTSNQSQMQRTNKFGKLWTPANMLASIGGQHIGLKPQRPGLIPLNDETVKYGTLQKGIELASDAGFLAKKAAAFAVDVTPLDVLHDRFTNWNPANDFWWKADEKGGFDSLYGINITGPTAARRYDNTLDNVSQKKGNDKAKYTQTYQPLNKEYWYTPLTPDEFNTYSDDLPQSTDEAQHFGVADADRPEVGSDSYSDGLPQDADKAKTFGLAGIDRTGGGSNSLDANGNTNGDVPGAEVIKDYETIAYGNIPERVAGNTSNTNDFRSYLTDKNPNKKIANSDNYSEFNINKRVNFGNPGQLGESENRYQWWNTDKTKGGTGGKNDRYDKINAAPVGAKHILDLVNVWFRPVGVDTDRMQFRGTVNGITDTFSPTWDPFKYNGRADQSYRYSSFERSLSFNLQVYATSRIEMVPIWQKLARLSTLTMPQYSTSPNGGYQGMLIEFRIGDLYRGELAFIESLSYTMSDETPWEISMLGSNEPIGELPMGVEVAFGLKILGKAEPRYGQLKVYGNNEG